MKKLKINWSKAGAALTASLTMLAALPYETGMQQIGELFGEKARHSVLFVGISATLLLRVLASLSHIVEVEDPEKELQKDP